MGVGGEWGGKNTSMGGGGLGEECRVPHREGHGGKENVWAEVNTLGVHLGKKFKHKPQPRRNSIQEGPGLEK